MFDFLMKDKIELISSIDTGIDMGDAGKFFKISEYKNVYYFSIDDDLIYPPNYVKNTISELKKFKNQSVVSYHGKIYDEYDSSYYQDIKKEYNYRCLDELTDDKVVEFPGTGVMCFHTDYFNLKFEDFEYPNMSDIFLGLQIKKQKKKCICLKHKKGWIRHADINTKNSIYVINKQNPVVDEVFNRRKNNK